MIRTIQQENFQRFDVQELALSVSLKPEQLTFRAFIEGDRFDKVAASKFEPKANRATRVFDLGIPVSYRFLETLTAPKVRFCWTVHRNAAGRFLIFRERVTRRRVIRDRVEAILDKRAAIAACKLNRNDVDLQRAKKAAKRAALAVPL